MPALLRGGGLGEGDSAPCGDALASTLADGDDDTGGGACTAGGDTVVNGTEGGGVKLFPGEPVMAFRSCASALKHQIGPRTMKTMTRIVPTTAKTMLKPMQAIVRPWILPRKFDTASPLLRLALPLGRNSDALISRNFQ